MTRYRPPTIDLYDINTFLTLNEIEGEEHTAFVSVLVKKINNKLQIPEDKINESIEKWVNRGIFELNTDKTKISLSKKYQINEAMTCE